MVTWHETKTNSCHLLLEYNMTLLHSSPSTIQFYLFKWGRVNHGFMEESRGCLFFQKTKAERKENTGNSLRGLFWFYLSGCDDACSRCKSLSLQGVCLFNNVFSAKERKPIFKNLKYKRNEYQQPSGKCESRVRKISFTRKKSVKQMCFVTVHRRPHPYWYPGSACTSVTRLGKLKTNKLGGDKCPGSLMTALWEVWKHFADPPPLPFPTLCPSHWPTLCHGEW